MNDRPEDQQRTGDRQQQQRRVPPRTAGWVSLSVPLKLAISVTLAFSAVVSAYSYITVNVVDTGWDVISSSVKTDHSVLIDKSLKVSKDLTIGNEGSYLEVGATDCPSEEKAPPGAGRLCYDAGLQGFMVSQDGGDYQELAYHPSPRLMGTGTLILAPDDTFNSDPVIYELTYAFEDFRATAVIPLPDEFLEAARDGRLNVQLTPEARVEFTPEVDLRSSSFGLSFYIDLDAARVVVINDVNGGTGNFHYLIQIAP